MSYPPSTFDKDKKNSELDEADSFYSVDSNLPPQSKSCLSVLSEYDQDSLQAVFSEIDCEDSYEGTVMVGTMKPLDEVEEKEKQNYIDVLKKYKNAAERSSEESEEGDNLPLEKEPMPDLPDSSSESERDAPMSPLVLSEEEYVEYLDMPVPTPLQNPRLRTPFLSFLRDVMGVMVNARDEPLYSLQRFDPKTGCVRLVRKGELFRLVPNKPPVPILETVERSETREQPGTSGQSSSLGAESTPARPLPCHSVEAEENLKAMEPVPSSSSASQAVPGTSKVPSKGVSFEPPGISPTLVERAVSPDRSSHYSQTSSVDYDSDESDVFIPSKSMYTFTCPIFNSEELSIKKFPGEIVEPLIHAGMKPPEIFRTILKEQGVFKALEAVLDMGQTYMS